MGARRVTISDIAQAAGVSTASVSYALSGKDGVSDETRERILAVARAYRWSPSRAAQMLSSQQARAVGLVVPAFPEALQLETFSMLFISGLEGELRTSRRSVLLHLEPDRDLELEIYRGWREQGAVDAVVLTDLVVDDPRIHLLAELGLPTVLSSQPRPDPGVPSVANSEEGDMRLLLSALAEQGATSCARIGGTPNLLIVQERTDAFGRATQELGLVNRGSVSADFTSDAVAELTIDLMQHPDGAPDAIVYDSDLMAARGLQALLQNGFQVPDDVMVAAFDDSVLCQLATPPITALDRHIVDLGRTVARLASEPGIGPHLTMPPAELRLRASTARHPRQEKS